MQVITRTLAAAGLFATLTGAANAQGSFNTNGTVVFYDAVGNLTLDPQEPQNNSSFAQGMIMAIFDALVYLDPKGEPTPGLAQSWSYNADLTQFTMQLRPGVTFHDGAPFNADAVKKNFDRVISLGARAGFASLETMAALSAIEVTGPMEIRLTLKEPNGQLPYLLGSQAGMMISPAALEGNAFGAQLKPVGAGPYRVRSAESNVRTNATRYDGYWGGTAGRPAALEAQFVPDGRARLNALRSGQANLALIDPRQIAEAKAAGLEVQVNEKNSTWDFYLNVKRDNISNLKLRQAMMHGLDRAAIVDALGFGASQPTAQLFASSSPMYMKELDAIYPFDPAKAKKLVAEAGYPNGVDVTWLLLNTTEYRTLAEAIQAMWGEVGIRVKFDTVDTSQFVQFKRGPRGDVMMARWGGRPDPLQAFQEVAGATGSVNPGGAAVPEIDTLIAKARAMSPDNPARMEVLRQLNKLTTEQVSHIGIMTRSAVYAFKPGCITGLPAYLPTGNDRLNDVKMGASCK